MLEPAELLRELRHLFSAPQWYLEALGLIAILLMTSVNSVLQSVYRYLIFPILRAVAPPHRRPKLVPSDEPASLFEVASVVLLFLAVSLLLILSYHKALAAID